MKEDRVWLRWIALLIFVILLHHILLIAVQNVLPYSETFGRESSVGTTTNTMPPIPLPGGSFVYLEGESIVFQEREPGSKRNVKKLALPDPSLKQSSQYTILSDAIYWIYKDRLFRSHLDGSSWGQVSDMGTATTFDVTEAGNTVYLTVSDDRQLRIAKWMGDQMSPWYYVRIQDVTRIKTGLHQNGNLLIASLAEYGTSGEAFWWTEWSPDTGKVIRQSKILSFQLAGGQTVKDFELGLDVTAACLFHTVETPKIRSSQLYFTRFSIDDPIGIQSDEVFVNGKNKRNVSDPRVNIRQAGEFDTVVTADGQVYLLRFRQGEKVGEERVSGKLANAIHPVFVSDGEEKTRTLVWLNQSSKGAFSIVSTSDEPGYRDQMNRFRLIDLLQATRQIPSLLVGAVYALAASVKWVVVPYLYLGIVRLIGRKLRNQKWAVHYWLAVGMYLVTKLVFAGQFYSGQTLAYMPAWMIPVWSKYLVTVIIAVLSLLVAGTFRKETVDRSLLRMFTRFVALDVLITVLWYGFFIR